MYNNISWPIDPSEGQVYQSPNGDYWVRKDCMWVSTCCPVIEFTKCGDLISLFLEFEDDGFFLAVFSFDSTTGNYIVVNAPGAYVRFNSSINKWELLVEEGPGFFVAANTIDDNIYSSWTNILIPGALNIQTIHCGEFPVFPVSGSERMPNETAYNCDDELLENYFFALLPPNNEDDYDGIVYAYLDNLLTQIASPGYYLIDTKFFENSDEPRIVLIKVLENGIVNVELENPCSQAEKDKLPSLAEVPKEPGFSGVVPST
jgi:hypothetical protein